MKLLRPAPAMKDAFGDYVRDWEEHNETVCPAAARLAGRTYEEWLHDIRRLETQPTEKYVTQNVYFAFDDTGKLLGVIALRHTLTGELLRTGGHIGYGVRPSARRQGVATAMLAAVLPYARARGMRRVMVACHKENTASARTILHNGGVLENELRDGEHLVQRYWIELLYSP